MNITYISSENSNSISCLDDSELSSYILSENEQRYFETIYDNTTAYLSSISLVAAIKAGSTLYTQDKLDKIYVNRNNSLGFTNDDVDKIKNFMNSFLVGNGLVDFGELKGHV